MPKRQELVKSDSEEGERLRQIGHARLDQAWKMMDYDKDPMPKLSYQQELMLFVQPTEGSIPTHHRNKKTEFGEYLRKANELHVNLKSTSH